MRRNLLAITVFTLVLFNCNNIGGKKNVTEYFTTERLGLDRIKKSENYKRIEGVCSFTKNKINTGINCTKKAVKIGAHYSSYPLEAGFKGPGYILGGIGRVTEQVNGTIAKIAGSKEATNFAEKSAEILYDKFEELGNHTNYKKSANILGSLAYYPIRYGINNSVYATAKVGEGFGKLLKYIGDTVYWMGEKSEENLRIKEKNTDISINEDHNNEEDNDGILI